MTTVVIDNINKIIYADKQISGANNEKVYKINKIIRSDLGLYSFSGQNVETCLAMVEIHKKYFKKENLKKPFDFDFRKVVKEELDDNYKMDEDNEIVFLTKNFTILYNNFCTPKDLTQERFVFLGSGGLYAKAILNFCDQLKIKRLSFQYIINSINKIDGYTSKDYTVEKIKWKKQ